MADFDRFRALSFDCYGTLIDWETGIVAGLAPWAAAHDVPANREELVESFASVETLVQAANPTMPYPQVLALVLRDLAKRWGRGVTDAETQAFGASVAAWPAFPDSAASLRRLGERFVLVVLSNVDRTSFAASTRRLGVEFDLILTAEDVGAYKPDPAGFRALLEALPRLGVARHELLHVAQSLYHDHEPAQRLGLPSVWIDRRGGASGYGATPPPRGAVAPRWRYPSLAAFTAAALDEPHQGRSDSESRL